jgi:transposase
MAIEELAPSPGNPGEAMLEENEVGAVFALRRRSWGIKAIAREMGMAPNTVRFWIRRGENAPHPIMGRPRVLDDWLPWVKARFQEGVRNGDVLRQELASFGIHVSLRTVERSTAGLRKEALCQERATLRFETEPGHQLQVDFGECWLEVAGERVKVFVFVGTLGYSRRTYARIFPGLCQAHWLEGLEGCLRHFGGAPETFLVDNARALVSKWKGDQPVFHPEFQAFCDHYGIRPRACRPYRARTKGKVESGVKYVKRNALGRRCYESWEALEAHLAWWMREVADARIHGTTHERPSERFQREQEAMAPLQCVRPYRAVRRFSRRVALDARVQMDTNRYSVPWELAGQRVELEAEGERLTVTWRGTPVAQHHLHPGRHQEVVDPVHLEGLVQRTFSRKEAGGVIRSLDAYAKAAGGEAW